MRSSSPSRSQLQSTIARRVWCCGSAVRLPADSSANRSSSRPATWAAVSDRSRAAASSMASGLPSSARQIRTAGPTLLESMVNPGRTAPARSASSRTAPYSMASPAVTSGGGSGSAGTGQSVSPITPSGSRLVARMRTSGAAASTRPASSATAAIRCSQLSSTSTSRWLASASVSRSSGGSTVIHTVSADRRASGTPSAASTACGTSSASRTGASGMNQAPSGD